MEEYGYPVAADKAIYVSGLAVEINAALDPNTRGVVKDGTGLRVQFDNPLGLADKALLDGVIDSHEGIKPMDRKLLGASTLLRQDVSVSNETEWQQLAGVVSRPSFFTPNLASVVGQVLGQMFCVGGGAEIRLVEDVDGGGGAINVMTEPYVVPDTAGKWSILVMLSDKPPSEGSNVYHLEARRNGAASLKIKNTSLTLIEMVP